jgi:hypothetical protein
MLLPEDHGGGLSEVGGATASLGRPNAVEDEVDEELEAVAEAPVAGCVFGADVGLVMAHFVIYSGLWRQRDGASRAFMTERLTVLGDVT